MNKIIKVILASIVIILAGFLSCRKNNNTEKTTTNERIECKEKTLKLNQAPGGRKWGKKIEKSSGNLIYCQKYKEYLKGKIVINGLTPNNDYMLCLNSKPRGAGSKYLPDEYQDERKKDFYQFTTDSFGNYNGEFEEMLEPSSYSVKLFVKDMNDWQIVLYNDYLDFRVTE